MNPIDFEASALNNQDELLSIEENKYQSLRVYSVAYSKAMIQLIQIKLFK